LAIPISVQHTALVYVYQGGLVTGTADKVLKTGQLGQLVDGDSIHLATLGEPVLCLVLAAKPLNEPMVQSGPFVMNSKAEIEQAYQDYRASVLTL
jgi:redox-sensitive bicupin YhaK (pirin superfamily)